MQNFVIFKYLNFPSLLKFEREFWFLSDQQNVLVFQIKSCTNPLSLQGVRAGESFSFKRICVYQNNNDQKLH